MDLDQASPFEKTFGARFAHSIASAFDFTWMIEKNASGVGPGPASDSKDLGGTAGHYS
jgi:hypothetical protein